MNGARQQRLFDDFWSTGDYNIQNGLLYALMRRQSPEKQTTGQPTRRQSTFKYFLPDEEGIMQDVCKATFLTVLGVSGGRIQTIQTKISTGRLLISDGRGGHENRPHTIPQQVRDDILEHINSFPSELSHYTRNVSSFDLKCNLVTKTLIFLHLVWKSSSPLS